MSGLDEERLVALEKASDFQRDLPWVTRDETERAFLVTSIREMPRLISEIRRQRAENAELRASYERVDRALEARREDLKALNLRSAQLRRMIDETR